MPAKVVFRILPPAPGCKAECMEPARRAVIILYNILAWYYFGDIARMRYWRIQYLAIYTHSILIVHVHWTRIWQFLLWQSILQSPNHQIKTTAKISRYTVHSKPRLLLSYWHTIVSCWPDSCLQGQGIGVGRRFPLWGQGKIYPMQSIVQAD